MTREHDQQRCTYVSHATVIRARLVGVAFGGVRGRAGTLVNKPNNIVRSIALASEKITAGTSATILAARAAFVFVALMSLLGTLVTSAQDLTELETHPSSEATLTEAPLHDCMLIFRFGDDPTRIPRRGSSEARAINESGQIAGWIMGADSTARAVRWEPDGSVTEFGTLGGRHSCALGINGAGDVVGWAQTSNGEAHAFVWADGVMTDLGKDRDDLTVGFSINDRGDVVGMAWPIVSVPVGSMGRALAWTEAGTTDLGTCLDVPCSAALDINNAGQIVGWLIGSELRQRAFLWDGASRTDLGGMAAERSQARAINDAGAVVGWFENTDGIRRAGLWTDGSLTEIGSTDGHAVANDISPTGVIAGATGRVGENLNPVLWTPDELVSLGNLGGVYGEAYATNQLRETVGWSQTTTGVPHAFVWRDGRMVDLTPKPTTT